ncbi:prolyl oligopeptidase family serine peptidase [Streptomyces sp. ISL-100]|uniref:prolyl oligopeptidase family serine peptidase n=1 Tax=Streptomyces sp. ISL-100 TaxID=2819173 RepID=UPI001BEBE436|nr:prolyl oligopeptidase family serine peptidase [Streptomyces sp. ISL-100]MBT2396337.1 prolyl oligopeptidase family serine peptidase [Streptomyces sp. ISL-100]
MRRARGSWRTRPTGRPAWWRTPWEASSGPYDLDLGRVGIRGWSFGGYLAAAAVLHRPDVYERCSLVEHAGKLTRPLVIVTQEGVADTLLLLELDFLKKSLGC